MTKELKSKVEELFKKKKYSAILDLYKKNQNQFNQNKFLLEGLCLSNFNLGNNNEAEKSAKKIISIDAKHLGANHVLARVLTSKNVDEAIKFYKKIIILSNNAINYLTEYAGLLFSLGSYEEPIKILQGLVNKNPKNLSFKISLSRAYIENHNYDEAIALLEKVLDETGNTFSKHEILNLIGTAYHNNGDYDKAKEYYSKSIDEDDRHVQAYINLAVLEQEYGFFEQARFFLDKVNQIKKNSEAYLLISAGKKFKDENDLDILNMLAFDSSLNLDQKDRSALHFALGKAYEDLKNYPVSSKYYKNANNLRRKQFKNYDFDKELEIINEMKDIFNEKFFNFYSKKNNLGEGLIFIVGMPRSGTTLLEQILSSHDNIFGAGELNYFTQSIDLALDVYDFVNFKKKILDFDTDYVSKMGQIYTSKINTIVKKVNKKKFIIDKNPLNFKNIPLIFASLPKSKVIHIKRNQNDNCLSIYKNYFYHNVMPWSYSQDELKKYYLAYDNYLNSLKNYLPNFIYDIKYEDITNSLENSIKPLLNFLGVSWDKKCLEFHKNKRSVRTASINQVRQTVYQSSKNSWHNYRDFFENLFI